MKKINGKLKVNKRNYEVVQSIDGEYWRIERKYNAPYSAKDPSIVWGDSANADAYNEEYVKDLFSAWDGTVDEEGDLLTDFDAI